jgi:hypothetical protein
MPKRKDIYETYYDVPKWVVVFRELKEKGMRYKDIAQTLTDMRFERPSVQNWETIVRHRQLYDWQLKRKLVMMEEIDRKLRRM